MLQRIIFIPLCMLQLLISMGPCFSMNPTGLGVKDTETRPPSSSSINSTLSDEFDEDLAFIQEEKEAFAQQVYPVKIYHKRRSKI